MLQRLNVVFHGMMLFVEEKDHIDVLIPKFDFNVHEFRHGRPGEGDPGVLAPNQDWTLQGPTSSNKTMADLVPAHCALMIRQSMMACVPGKKRNCFSVPTPDVIRLYRGMEVNRKIFGHEDPDSIAFGKRVPGLVHDAVVFSYLNCGDSPCLISGAERIDFPGNRPLQMDNWCIYAEPSKMEKTAHDVSPMLSLMEFRVAAGVELVGKNPRLDLSYPAPVDGYLTPAGTTGIDVVHLKNLYEILNPILSNESDPPFVCPPVLLVNDL